MRIIAGIAKGRRLQVPDSKDVRPTTDRVREALFSHLGGRVPQSAVLDLFAGSGALGLESLSRGATSAVFVEKSRAIFNCLQKNVSMLGFAEQSRCYAADGVSWVKKNGRSQQFDLIFLDPPYDSDCLSRSLQDIAACGCLHPEGLIVAEHRAELSVGMFKDPLGLPVELQIVRTKQYGKTAVTTLTRTRSSEIE